MTRQFSSRLGDKNIQKVGQLNVKAIGKIAIILVFFVIIFYVLDTRVKENEPLESPVKHGTAIPSTEQYSQSSRTVGSARPKQGISQLVGQSVDVLKETYGEPDRIEPSAYEYDWWIFLEPYYLMVGVQKGVVNQIFSTDQNIDLFPFDIGQDVNEVYRFTIVDSEVDVQIGDNLYTFSLKSEDVMTRLLVKFDNLFAQIYVDQEDNRIEGVRFLDAKTIVIHQPYDMEYRGELITAKQPSSHLQIEIDRAMERQIVELTNAYRRNHQVAPVTNDFWLSTIAQNHSKEMALENYFAHNSPSKGTLANRLKDNGIEHRKAGENIALNYVDAIEAVHGWLNSSDHREILLDKDFTHIGTGVYSNYYTQDMIQLSDQKQEKNEIRE